MPDRRRPRPKRRPRVLLFPTRSPRRPVDLARLISSLPADAQEALEGLIEALLEAQAGAR